MLVKENAVGDNEHTSNENINGTSRSERFMLDLLRCNFQSYPREVNHLSSLKFYLKWNVRLKNACQPVHRCNDMSFMNRVCLTSSVQVAKVSGVPVWKRYGSFSIRVQYFQICLPLTATSDWSFQSEGAAKGTHVIVKDVLHQVLYVGNGFNISNYPPIPLCF